MKVLRLLIYEGPEEWVMDTLNKSSVKGKHCLSNDRSITEITLGTIPDNISVLLSDERREEIDKSY